MASVPALLNINRPNELFSLISSPTTPAAPKPPYRTRSTTAAEHASNNTAYAYQATAYTALLVEETGSLIVPTFSDDQFEGYINAWLNRLLAYFNKYLDNELILKACHIRLHQQADGSYLSRSGSSSVNGGISYLSNDDPTKINGAIHVMSTVIPTGPSCHP